MNKIVLMGRLTKDPETRYTQTTNKMVVNFTLAVNRRMENETDFIDCIAWGKTAEFISKYFSKGNQIATIGRLQKRSYTNKENKNVYITEVVVEEAYFTGKKENDGAAEESEEPEEYATEVIGDPDELPF